MDSTTIPKLFVCKSTGCNLSFTNEDHLNIHEKKHEIIFTLENKGSNVFLADQTPTPTKLIKNCEEVGLFDDLRNVNPFDETFRRAVETNSNLNNNLNHDTPTEHKILLLDEDTLHTPQVYPIETDEANNNCQNFRIDDEKIILSTNLEKKKRKTSVKLQQIDENSTKSIKRQKSLTEIVLKSNANKNINISPTIPPATERTLISASSKISPILPNIINLIQPQNITWIPGNKLILPKPMTTVISNQSEKYNNDIKERLKTIITNKDSIDISVNKNKLTNGEELTYKSNQQNKKLLKKTKNQTSDSLERRRAAAVRYRKRRHIQLCDLQKCNAELLAENVELKSKLKQLQEILIAHRNCDLTKTTIQNSPNGITSQLLRKSIPLIQIPASTIVMKIPKLLIQPGDIQL